MSKNLFIMLIDDNKIDLFIHGEVIKRIPEVSKTLAFTFAEEALSYLENKDHDWPNLILLDIHMPIMNGFDFLAKYERLPQSRRENCRILMVSSSLDSGDLKKATSNAEVFAFLEKPMDINKLTELLPSVS